MLIAAMSLSNIIHAEDVVLPAMNKPSALQEGTQRDLTSAQIAELIPWAKNSKSMLQDLLESTQGLSTEDRIERLSDGIKLVVSDSAPKNSELLMRYTLNRSLVLLETLNKEIDTSSVGSGDVKFRVLKLSIQLALKYFDADIATLTNSKSMPFADFGIEYFNFLTDLNKSIFDASAQFSIQRISLEWLQWDLYRDLNNTAYAAEIVKINNLLKMIPATVKSDKSSISSIKQMKLLIEQLKISSKKSVSYQVNEIDVQKSFRAGGDGRCYKENSEGQLITSSAYSVSDCTVAYRAGGDGRCYGVDKTGRMLTSNSYSVSNCTVAYKAGGDGRCYGTDADGRMLTSDHYSVSACTAGYRAGGDGRCYGIDTDGKMLTSDHYSVSACTETYRAGSDGRCYGEDAVGTLLTSDYYSVSSCTVAYKFGSNNKCYGVDSRGKMLTSDYYSSSACE